jgi:hypothetical protein
MNSMLNLKSSSFPDGGLYLLINLSTILGFNEIRKFHATIANQIFRRIAC